MTKQERFATFDNTVYEAMTELMGSIPTDITLEDVDLYLGKSDLSCAVKAHIRSQQNDTVESLLCMFA